MSCAYKSDTNNKMKCLVCRAEWCWTCRQRLDDARLGNIHYEWYNVFGCPGLLSTPNYFLIGLAAKMVVSLASPLTLLFAPLVVSIAYYKSGSNLVKDQAERFRDFSCLPVHKSVAKAIALLGFSLLGLVAGALLAAIVAPFGIVYQLCIVFVRLGKGLCSNVEVREEESLSEFDSPTKSPYISLASQQQNFSSGGGNLSFENTEGKGTGSTMNSPMLIGGHSINADGAAGGHFDSCDPII